MCDATKCHQNRKLQREIFVRKAISLRENGDNVTSDEQTKGIEKKEKQMCMWKSVRLEGQK